MAGSEVARRGAAEVDTYESPFDPETGAFRHNVRLPGGDTPSDAELCESMMEFGWLQFLPGIMDEHGVLITGHRRSAMAGKLGIPKPWPIVTVQFGDGPDADAHRLRLAVASNIGARPFTKDDRIAIAKHLYGERKWTLKKIADALGVSTATAGRDLEGFVPEGTLARPQGGRPKGAQTRQIGMKELNEIIDEGLGYPTIMKRYDVGRSAAQAAATRAQTIKEYRQQQAEMTAFPAHSAPPPVNRLALPAPPPPAPPVPKRRPAPADGKTPQGQPAVQPPRNLPPAPAQSRPGALLEEVNGWVWDEATSRWVVPRGDARITISLPRETPPPLAAHLFGIEAAVRPG
jgi:hypothetical protein